MEETKKNIEEVLKNETEKKKFYDLVKCSDLYKYARMLKIKNYKLLNKTELTDAVVETANQENSKKELAELNENNQLCGKYFQTFRTAQSPSEVLKCVLEKRSSNFIENMTKKYEKSKTKCKGKNYTSREVGAGIGTDDCPMGYVLLKPGDPCCVRLSSITGTSNYEEFMKKVGSQKDQQEFLRLMESAEEGLLMKDFAVEESLQKLMKEINKNSINLVTPIFVQKMNHSIETSTKTLCEVEEEANTFVARMADNFGKAKGSLVALKNMLQQNFLVKGLSTFVGFGKKAVHKVANFITMFVALLKWIYKNMGIELIVNMIGRSAAIALKKVFKLTKWVAKTAWGAALKVFGWAKAVACFIIGNPATSAIFLRLVNRYKRNMCREIGKMISNQNINQNMVTGSNKKKKYLAGSGLDSYVGEEWLEFGDDIFAKLFSLFEDILKFGRNVPEIMKKAVQSTEKEFSVNYGAQQKIKQKNFEKKVAAAADAAAKKKSEMDKSQNTKVAEEVEEKTVLATTWSWITDKVQSATETATAYGEAATEIVDKVVDTKRSLHKVVDRVSGRVMADVGKKGIGTIGSLAGGLASGIPFVGGVLKAGVDILSEELGEELGNVVSNTMQVQLVTRMNTDIVESVTLFLNLVDIEACVLQWPNDIKETSLDKIRQIKNMLGFPNNTFYSDQEIFSFIENLTYISSENKQSYLDMDSTLVKTLGTNMNTQIPAQVLKKYLVKKYFPRSPQPTLRSISNMSGIRRLLVSEVARIIEKYCKDSGIDEVTLEACINDEDEVVGKQCQQFDEFNKKVKNLIAEKKAFLKKIVVESNFPQSETFTF